MVEMEFVKEAAIEALRASFAIAPMCRRQASQIVADCSGRNWQNAVARVYVTRPRSVCATPCKDLVARSGIVLELKPWTRHAPLERVRENWVVCQEPTTLPF